MNEYVHISKGSMRPNDVALRVAAIRERLGNRTQGEWRNNRDIDFPAEDGYLVYVGVQGQRFGCVRELAHVRELSDAELMSHAPDDIAFLLEQFDALGAVLAERSRDCGGELEGRVGEEPTQHLLDAEGLAAHLGISKTRASRILGKRHVAAMTVPEAEDVRAHVEHATTLLRHELAHPDEVEEGALQAILDALGDTAGSTVAQSGSA